MRSSVLYPRRLVWPVAIALGLLVLPSTASAALVGVGGSTLSYSSRARSETADRHARGRCLHGHRLDRRQHERRRGLYRRDGRERHLRRPA